MKCPVCNSENYTNEREGLVKGNHAFIRICENGHKYGFVTSDYEIGYGFYTGNWPW